MIKIYGKKKSRAIRCLWALEELEIPYEHVVIDQDAGDNRTPDYLALNPSGKVPTLAEDGFVLTESMAINLYLADKKPSALLPGTPQERAAVLQWTFWAVTEAEYHVTVIVREFRRGEGRIDQSRVADALAALGSTVNVLELHLQKSGDYIVGDRFTMADLNAASVLCYLGLLGFDMEPHPLTNAWLKRCLARPAWVRLQD